jgi:hypothetical protein
MQSIVSGKPVNLVLIRSRRRLVGFRPCSLIVARGKHVALPPTIDSDAKQDGLLFEQVTTISDGKVQHDMLGKCFPVGPRHVCLTLHQVVQPPELQDAIYSVIKMSANSKNTFVVPSSHAANVGDKSKDFVILEVDAPKDVKPFKKWLYPEAPDAKRAIYCPIKVPETDLVPYLVQPLIAAWTDQGLDIPLEVDQITAFFRALGRPGTFATLKGDIASLRDGLMGFRIPIWSSQSGGYITHQRADATMFCGIVCCSGTSDATSNFNAAIAADNEDFLRQYTETVLPTLEWTNLPTATKRLVDKLLSPLSATDANSM